MWEFGNHEQKVRVLGEVEAGKRVVGIQAKIEADGILESGPYPGRNRVR